MTAVERDSMSIKGGHDVVRKLVDDLGSILLGLVQVFKRLCLKQPQKLHSNFFSRLEMSKHPQLNQPNEPNEPRDATHDLQHQHHHN